MGRAPCCERMGLKKGPWKPEEDQILINYIKENGHDNWRALPNRAGLLRCGKSCRLRWMNYLRPDIKRGNFTREEEEAIIKLHAELGNKWSVIAAKLPGRTDNEIKNVWNTHLKKRLHKRSRPEPEPDTKILKNDSSFGSKSEKYSEPTSPAHSTGETSSITVDTAMAGGGSDDFDACLMTGSLEGLVDIDGGFWSEISSSDVWSGASHFSACSSDFQLQFLNSFAYDLSMENYHGFWYDTFL